MDKMSIFAILTMSVPEAVAGFYLSFIITGTGTKLPFKDNKEDRKGNIIRFLLAVISFVAIAVMSRRYIDNIVIICTANILLATVVFKFIYKISYTRAFVINLVHTLFLLSVESIYMPIGMKFMELSFKGFYSQSNDFLRLELSLIDRIFQIAAIITFWNWKVVENNMEKYKETKSLIMATVIVLAFIEITFSYIYIYAFSLLPVLLKIIGFCGNLFFVVLNVLILKTYIKTCRAVRKEAMKNENI